MGGWGRRTVNSDREEKEIRFQRVDESRLSPEVEEWLREWHVQGDGAMEASGWLRKAGHMQALWRQPGRRGVEPHTSVWL